MSTSTSNRVTILENTKNHIVINGKKYDAVSGSLLHTVATAAGQPFTQRSKAKPGAVIDGFIRVSRGSATIPLQPIPAKAKQSPRYVAGPKSAYTHKPTIATATYRKPHSPAVSINPHAPQKASTLMRSAVKKPKIAAPDVIKAQTRTDLLAVTPAHTVVPKMSYNTVNKFRSRRAERMIQSPSVSRYSKPAQVVAVAMPTVTPSIAQQARPIAQQAKPLAHLQPHKQIHLTNSQQRTTTSINGLRLIGAKRSLSAHNSVNTPHQSYPAITASPTNQLVPPADHEDADIFKMALADATSHEQTYAHKSKHGNRKGKFLRLATGSMIALFLLGFLAYQNTPSLSLKIASYRAGLDAKLPASQPNGYNFGYLSYEPGNVVVNFTSESDSRQFNISQKASSWDSQGLLNNFVAGANSAYKTYQRAGRTVYVLSNNTATWVDSGIWYTVDGNSSLSSKQLLDIAGNM